MYDAMILKHRYILPSYVFSKEVDEELVLLDLDRGEYYALNELGRALWIALSKGETPEAVVDKLLLEYDVSARELKLDLCAIIVRLLEKKLLLVDSIDDTELSKLK